MSLRIKTLFSIGIILILLIFVISAMAIAVMSQSAATLENIEVQTDVERVVKAIAVRGDALKVKLADWSVWDDAYAFVVNHNPRFIQSNLIADVYKNLQINSIIFVDTKGTIVFGKIVDLTTGVESSPSADLIARIQPVREKLLRDPSIKDITGIVQLIQGPLLLSAQPILKSSGEGPPAGIVIFAKFIDESFAKDISDLTRTTLAIYPLNVPLPEEHDKTVLAKLLAGGPAESVVLDDKTVAGYAVMKDIDNNTALLLDMTLSRDFYTQVIQSLWYLLVRFIGAIAVALILILLIIEAFVMSPLIQLRREIGKMSTSGDLSKRLTELKSRDELSGLSKDLNKMLQSMEYTQRLLSSEKEKSHIYIDVVNLIIVVISADETIMLLNKKGCELLELTEAEAVGKNWFDLCVPADIRGNIRTMFGKITKGELKDFEQAENAVITKSGKRRIISWKNSVIKNNEGAVIATISSGEDITDRSDSEKKLHEREKQLTLAQQMAGIGSWEWSIADNSVTWSDEIYAMVGSKPTPLSGMSDAFLRFVHPDDRKTIDTAIENAQKEHTPIKLEARFLRPDGEIRIISLQGQIILDDHNNPSRVIGIAQDLTEAKRSEEKILARTRDLESMNKTMIGREVRMGELKKQIETLTRELETYKENPAGAPNV
jgi:PAS domain S-box-containing protein